MMRAFLAVLLVSCSLSLSAPVHASSPHSHARPIHALPPHLSASFPWFDATLSIQARVDALIAALTVEQKASQLEDHAVGIPELGIPTYDWTGEGSHGVARAGRATVFPSPIALAATFDTDLLLQAGQILATEARGKVRHGHSTAQRSPTLLCSALSASAPTHCTLTHSPCVLAVQRLHQQAQRLQHHLVDGRHTSAVGVLLNGPLGVAAVSDLPSRLSLCCCRYGLNFYAPNINIAIHPRWGRLQETFGEDPYLSGALSVPFVTGMQDLDLPGSQVNATRRYVKVSATCKHFLAYSHSDPGELAHVTVSDADLQQSFLPMFHACVVEANARSVMCSYSTVNGYEACISPLLQSTLRDAWHWDGFLCSDDGAITLANGSNVTAKAAEALNAGVDLCLGGEYVNLPTALKEGLINNTRLNQALNRTLTERIRTGQWDPPSMVPWSKFGLEVVDTPAHREVARVAARESIVLLKNEGGLPLDLASLGSMAVVGPNANRSLTLLGNYCGCQDGQPGGQEPAITPGCVLVTPLMALLEAVEGENEHRRPPTPVLNVTFVEGARINGSDRSGFERAVEVVRGVEVAVVVVGLGTCVGPWGGYPDDCIEAEGIDRPHLGLTGVQPDLLRALIATGTPLILVVMSGSPVTLNEWVLAPSITAIVQLWYAGAMGGYGLTDILLGAYSPSGRLPVTIPYSEAQVPPDANYSMQAGQGRTYRYSTAVPLFQFGYGLSYTTFTYEKAAPTPVLSPRVVQAGDEEGNVTVVVRVVNTGAVEGTEVVQAYFSYHPLTPPTPLQAIPRTELKAFTRVTLAAGEGQVVTLSVPLRRLWLMGVDGEMGLLKGVYTVEVGGAGPGSKGMAVDGGDAHRRWVEVDAPAEAGGVGACGAEVKRWWGRWGGEDEASLRVSVELPSSIQGGVSDILTVC